MDARPVEPIKAPLKSEGRGILDAFALGLLFLTLFLLASLVSYIQPLLIPGPLAQLPEENWCGLLGFHCARFLFSFLGLAAFFPLCLLIYAMSCTLWAKANDAALIILGLSGAMFSSSALATALDLRLLPGDCIAPGGYLGDLLFRLIIGTTGHIGTLLILLLLLFFSLMACIRFSPFAPLRSLGRLLTEPCEKGQENEEPPPETCHSAVLQPPANMPPKPAQQPEPKKEERRPALVNKSRPKNKNFHLPDLSLLQENRERNIEVDEAHFYAVSDALTAKLHDFGVQGTVIGTSPGPVVTTYAFAPAPGVKINRVVNLADDLAMALKVEQVRVVGSIPGQAAIGIEVPNPVRNTVYLRDIFTSSEYQNADLPLCLALGCDVVGAPVLSSLTQMPHLLIAGATGAGKSVAINAFISSILFKAKPDEVKFLLIDPKRIELSIYDAIPHLLHPVVVEAKMASRALRWAVGEMERRYRLLEELHVKSFASYNAKAEQKLPYIVIIVDELADLMMVAAKDVETSIARLAQMARAAGIHLVLATQRPSVDVLTGLIKANFPTRISFKVASKVDSRIILDGPGAEHLLGMGDMLFLPPGTAKLQRIHGAFVSEQETERLVTFLQEQGPPDYDPNMAQMMAEEEESAGISGNGMEHDEKYEEAVAIVMETSQASISLLQRELRVGYTRATRLIKSMEREGIVGPADGSRPREVLAYAADREHNR